MGYTGNSAFIPFGIAGQKTDEPQSRIASVESLSALNISFVNGIAEKHPGVRNWNKTSVQNTQVSGGIYSFTEYYPDPALQRIMVLGGDGKLYRFPDAYTFSEVTYTGDTSTPELDSTTLKPTNQSSFIVGGKESVGNSRKLFILTGNNQIQVVVGDATTRTNINTPAPEWKDGKFPKFGIIYRNSLLVFGAYDNPHRFYMSDPADHENFTNANTYQFNVFPGEGTRLITAFVFKERLFLLKDSGLYQFVDTDPTPANWYVAKVNPDLAGASEQSVVNIFDDVLFKNQNGSITSLSAAFKFGDIDSSDVLSKLRIEKFMRQYTTIVGNKETWGLYYQGKKQIYFTYRGKSSPSNNRILVLDTHNDQVKASWLDAVAPYCLGQISDVEGVKKPMYGSLDGFIYEFDVEDRQINKNGVKTAYTYEVQTPHIDFGQLDDRLKETVKNFDFLELVFQPSGGWDVTVDVFIDTEFKETINFSQQLDRGLDDFVLDTDFLDGATPKPLRKPLHGQGRTISFRVRQSGVSQNARIEGLRVYFRAGDQKQIYDPRPAP